MKLLITLIIVLFYTVTYPADRVLGGNTPAFLSAESDSLYEPVKGANSENQKIDFKLGNMFYYDSPSLLQQEFLYYESYKDHYFQTNIIDDIQLQNKPLLHQSKLELSKALKMQYNFLKRNDLGSFGKILGGAVGISAVGLGIYHLIKYKDDYFK